MTRTALYESNDNATAEVTAGGLVKVHDRPGKAAVMVRYQGQVAVVSVSLPMGAPSPTCPPAKTFVDELVFANLKELGIPPSPLCDDATFLRRVSLDIAGRLPTEEEVKAFAGSRNLTNASGRSRRYCKAPNTPTSSPTSRLRC